MSRLYTHLELEKIFGIGSYIHCEIPGILPAPVLNLLYISVRDGPVSIDKVLLTVLAYRNYLISFLAVCGDDELNDALAIIKKIDSRERTYPEDRLDILRSWVSRQHVKRMLKEAGLE